MKVELLVDSAAFWSALRRDIASARERVYVQTFSFEDDDVGRALAAELLASRARDKRLVIDAFIDWALRDRTLYRPSAYFDRSLRAHAAATRQLVAHLCSSGVPVRKTNAMGRFYSGFFARNHKKLVVVDGAIAYVGGINFCQHNFDWHDLMVRFESEEIAEFLAADFLGTWEGTNRHGRRAVGDVEVHVLDGDTNAEAFAPILALIASARREIVVHSPYVTFPFLDGVIKARRRGVPVTLLTPEKNNVAVVAAYVLWHAEREGFRVHRYRGRMTHLKALLVDDVLVLGSSNFDYMSYAGHQEILVVVRDRAVVADFRRLVLEPDLAGAPLWPGTAHVLAGMLSDAFLRVVGRLGTAFTHLLPPERIVACEPIATASEHVVSQG